MPRTVARAAQSVASLVVVEKIVRSVPRDAQSHKRRHSTQFHARVTPTTALVSSRLPSTRKPRSGVRASRKGNTQSMYAGGATPLARSASVRGRFSSYATSKTRQMQKS